MSNCKSGKCRKPNRYPKKVLPYIPTKKLRMGRQYRKQEPTAPTLTIKPSPGFAPKAEAFCAGLLAEVQAGKLTMQEAARQARAWAKAHWDCVVETNEQEE